ncbi:hypothetical protein CRYUN_Cryun01aG0221200 [Craigia yunnanensis]
MAFLMPSPETNTASANFLSNPNHTPKFLKSLIISKNDDDEIWSRSKVRVDLKDIGDRVSGLNQSLKLYTLCGQFSVPVKRGSKLSKEEEEKQKCRIIT